MTTVRAAVVAVAVLLGALAARATAQPAGDPAALEASGQRHYELAEYPAAIADFKEAFRITDQPELLFNIAQASRLANDCKQALTFYRTYLRRLPGAANADKVKARITEMETCAAKPASDPATTGTTSTTSTSGTTSTTIPLPAPPPPRKRTWKTWAGFGAIGAGALGVGLGAVFAARGASKTDELRDACATSCDGPEARAIESAGRSANRNAMIGFIAGGALVATGVVLIVLDRRGGERAGPAVSVTAGGATAGWTWTF